MDRGRLPRSLVAFLLAACLAAGCAAPAPPAAPPPLATAAPADATSETDLLRIRCFPRPPSTPLKGLVLAADQKTGVFLLDRGQRDGIKVGDELTVYRVDAFVAVVVVDRVSEENCAVSVKVENGTPLLKAGLQIRRGDQVATVY